LDLEDNVTPKNIVAESPQEFRIVPYPAISFSQSNAVWHIIPPAPTTIISRYVRVRMQLQFSITVRSRILRILVKHTLLTRNSRVFASIHCIR
jgi:hypothetical protein